MFNLVTYYILYLFILLSLLFYLKFCIPSELLYLRKLFNIIVFLNRFIYLLTIKYIYFFFLCEFLFLMNYLLFIHFIIIFYLKFFNPSELLYLKKPFNILVSSNRLIYFTCYK